MIAPKGVIPLQGRDYPTWPFVLDKAHGMGLQGIATELLQVPTEENGNVAIVRAVATFAPDREGGEPRRFSGLGDASPKNVNAKIVGAVIRMAETRAMGRALRTGTNIGETMYEELPCDQQEEDRADRYAREMPKEHSGAKKAEVAGAQPERPKAKYEPGRLEGDAAMAGSKKPAQTGMTALGDVHAAKCDVCKLAMTAGQVAYCVQNKIDPPVHLSCARRGA